MQEKANQNQLLIGISAFIAIVGLSWLARRLLTQPSSLVKPSALDIGRKYLRGRKTDVDNLVNRVKDYPLVWLVGESGAGKSSLLVAKSNGLVTRLVEDKSYFPLYLEHWGAHWERGPREGLCRVLNDALGEATRERLGLARPVKVSDVMSVLGRLHVEIGQTPVLVFDQFDDYQTRHRDRFLRGQERTIVELWTLRGKNTFWRDVEELLEANKARCLFVTRTDMQWEILLEEAMRAFEGARGLIGRWRFYAAKQEALCRSTAGSANLRRSHLREDQRCGA